MHLTLERPSGDRYDVSLPYDRHCSGYRPEFPTPGFGEVMQRENFNALVDASREIVLLQWLDFEMDDLALVYNINTLVEYAEDEDLLGYDMVIDVTCSSGGSGGAFAIQRSVDKAFRTTFGNVRLNDLGQEAINYGRRACWSRNSMAFVSKRSATELFSRLGGY